MLLHLYRDELPSKSQKTYIAAPNLAITKAGLDSGVQCFSFEYTLVIQ